MERHKCRMSQIRNGKLLSRKCGFAGTALHLRGPLRGGIDGDEGAPVLPGWLPSQSQPVDHITGHIQSQVPLIDCQSEPMPAPLLNGTQPGN